MKLFQCQSCGNAVHFDNSVCVACGHRLGFLPDRALMTALEPQDGCWQALAVPGGQYVFCDNAEEGACNWLVPAESGPGFCIACRHNRLVPDLGQPDARVAWQRLERAKRQLFYSLLRWNLPMPDRFEDPEGGLIFDFLADGQGPDGHVETVLTGHEDGLITLNIDEADDAKREARRSAMGEPYRTLVGHFRHEIGHYYWDRLVDNGGPLEACRRLFGDDRIDYAAALRRHYAEGPPPDWPAYFISAYASAHPWEDFAETWAHYVHMVDALETARAFGLAVRPDVGDDGALATGLAFDPYTAGSVDDLIAAWIPLTVALNSLNRSMGLPDAYPFVMPEAIVAKLGFIHDLVRGASSGLASS